MRRAILATVVVNLIAGTSLAVGASGQIPAAKDPKIGTRVTITGCLHQGTSSDSFVLMGVTERPADSPPSIQPVPWAIYWLDSTDGLKARVGEMVDITGTITGRRPEAGKITVCDRRERIALQGRPGDEREQDAGRDDREVRTNATAGRHVRDRLVHFPVAARVQTRRGNRGPRGEFPRDRAGLPLTPPGRRDAPASSRPRPRPRPGQSTMNSVAPVAVRDLCAPASSATW